MPREDGIHNYHFGQIPEMPWKKKLISRLRDLADEIERGNLTVTQKDIPDSSNIAWVVEGKKMSVFIYLYVDQPKEKGDD